MHRCHRSGCEVNPCDVCEEQQASQISVCNIMGMKQKIYSLNHSSKQGSPACGTIVIIVENAIQHDVQQASTASLRAKEYLDLHHESTTEYPSSLDEITPEEFESLQSDIQRVVYDFDTSSSPLLTFIMSPGQSGYSNGIKLIRFLSDPMWQGVAEMRENVGAVIMLSFGQASVLLQDFIAALEALVNEGRVIDHVSAIGSMARTTFWRNLVRPNSAAIATGGAYTYQSLPLSDLDLQQITPRTFEATGSETSGSTEEDNTRH